MVFVFVFLNRMNIETTQYSDVLVCYER